MGAVNDEPQRTEKRKLEMCGSVRCLRFTNRTRSSALICIAKVRRVLAAALNIGDGNLV